MASPSVEELVERLTKHRTLGVAPRDQLEWLAARAVYVTREANQVVIQAGDPVEHLWIMLSGHATIRIKAATGTRKAAEWRGGDVAGLLPYSRLTTSPGVITTEEPLEYLLVHRLHFTGMIRECHDVTAALVHTMVDRARVFTSSDIHNERMLSLGRLSAGLAHELNNPASAVARSAEALSGRLDELQVAFRAFGALRLTEEQTALVDEVTRVCQSSVDPVRSPVERADREDVLADWLVDHGADERAAEALAETAVALEALDRLAAVLDGQALDVTLRALASTCSVRRLAVEIESAASRIHGLVASVKRFSYMDQAAVPEPVDVTRGLVDTLTVLRSKARAKRVGLALDMPPNLPVIQGYGGELNQVWANLIENALDAVPENGHVEMSAFVRGDSLIVCVKDDGPGIPPEIRPRIFEPFFTTKAVGQGTGLGLDTVRRVVWQHDGDVEVMSEPGHTEFRVVLPIAGPKSARQIT
jgi:signal transduction histidine kinase